MDLARQLLAQGNNLSPYITIQVQDIPLGSIYHTMMMPSTPLLGIASYLTMVKVWEYANGRTSQTTRVKSGGGGGQIMKAIIIAHNLILAVYSLWTFAGFFPTLLRLVLGQGIKDGFCDTSHKLWNEKLLAHGFWFYLSKYYEFVDTMIILAKGRPAGKLQTFHHSGAVFIMWLGNYIQSPYLSFFVFENSVIHSLMYSYYLATSLGIQPPGKQLLTRLQIGQFYIALAAGFMYSFVSDCQPRSSQKIFTYIFMAYIVVLIQMFTEFSNKTYKRNQDEEKKGV